MTKGTLYKWNQQILGWQSEESVECFFNAQKIINFFTHFSRELEELAKEVLALRKRFFEFQPGTDLMQTDKEGMGILLPGVTDEQVSTAWVALMSQEFKAIPKLQIHKTIN